MAKISKDQNAGTLHPRETLYVVGNLGSLNAESLLPADGCASFALDLRGTFNGTYEVSGTVDGTNWIPLPLRPVNQANVRYVAAVSGAVAGLWVGSCMGFRQIRVRCTAYTSGAAVATLSATNAPLDQSLQGLITTDLGTNTGAAAAAVTLTIAAPGAGLRQYLTYLAITGFASAVLTAGATPVIVTTTNLPGSLAFSVDAEARAAGVAWRYREDFSYPLAASAQNTAVTIVCPATTGVVWRVTAGWYVAP